MAFTRTPFDRPFILPTKEHSYFGNMPNSGGVVLEQDVALMNRIDIDRLSDLSNKLVLSGFLDIPSIPTNSYTTFGTNTFTIASLTGILNGTPFTFDQTGQASGNLVTLTSVDSIHTQDLIFLEFWTEQVDPTIGIIYRYGNTGHFNTSFFSNDTIDSDFGVAGSTRIQLRYRMRIVPNATGMSHSLVKVRGKKATPDSTHGFTLDTATNLWFSDTTTFANVLDFDDVTGIVYALPIVLVTRDSNPVDSDDFTDLRTPVRVQSGIITQSEESEGGVFTFPYIFSTTITTADPGSTFLRLNNATQNAATALYISRTDNDNQNISALLNNLDTYVGTNATKKARLRLVKKSDATKWIVFNITNKVNNTTWFNFTLTNIDSSSAMPFTNEDELLACIEVVSGQTTGYYIKSRASTILGTPTAYANATTMVFLTFPVTSGDILQFQAFANLAVTPVGTTMDVQESGSLLIFLQVHMGSAGFEFPLVFIEQGAVSTTTTRTYSLRLTSDDTSAQTCNGALLSVIQMSPV